MLQSLVPKFRLGVIQWAVGTVGHGRSKNHKTDTRQFKLQRLEGGGGGRYYTTQTFGNCPFLCRKVSSWCCSYLPVPMHSWDRDTGKKNYLDN